MARGNGQTSGWAAWVRRALVAGDALFILGVLASMALARQFWPADLANFLRVHMLAAGLAAFLLGLCFSGRTVKLAGFLAALASALPLLVLPPPAADDVTGKPVRIVSANLDMDNQDPSLFVQWMEEAKPDLIATQETSDIWQQTLTQMGDWAYQSSSDLPARSDMKLFSKFPILSETVVSPQSTDTDGRHPLRFEIDIDGAVLTLFVIHPQTPRSPSMWDERNAYLRDLTAAVLSEPKDRLVIVTGDWNTPLPSPWFTDFLEKTGFRSAQSKWFPRPTRYSLRSGIPQLGTPIDNLALSPAIGLKSFRNGPKVKSDHMPVIADVVLPAQ